MLRLRVVLLRREKMPKEGMEAPKAIRRYANAHLIDAVSADAAFAAPLCFVETATPCSRMGLNADAAFAAENAVR